MRISREWKTFLSILSVYIFIEATTYVCVMQDKCCLYVEMNEYNILLRNDMKYNQQFCEATMQKRDFWI